jgi:iron-sulfur cluster insertion protein
MTDMHVENNSDSSIELTEHARNKIQNLLELEGDDDLSLRVFVTGGGCSGFQYGFTFDDEGEEDDIVIAPEKNVRVLIDSLSYQYLQNSTLDYVEGLEGSRFVVTNPQAESTCGCGSSFSV